ncbi:MAG: glycoside hydrolase family 172 protein [Chitinophagaceae bacterium]
MKCYSFIVLMLLNCSTSLLIAQELYKAPAPATQTRWISPENPTGSKGAGGKTNRGAKGSAFFTLKAGEQLVLMDIKGAGIIHRMWLSGTIPRSEEQRRLVRIDMYWDGAIKPAVSAPIGDFFGIGLGLSASFQNELFSNPEGRSFNVTIPMPFRKSAKIVLTNESSSHALVWYDINYSIINKLPNDAMYFHAYWNRIPKTTIGVDYLLLPMVKGRGRFIETNVGVIGDPAYRNTWFGEGEVKIYLDGDANYPTLAGTGTEDYIGSGWGQGVYANRYQGSLIADTKNDLYAFYRYHITDPVYFLRECKVTLQQIGNTDPQHLKELMGKGVNLQAVWALKKGDSNDIFNMKGKAPEQLLLLDRSDFPPATDEKFTTGLFGFNFYRSDDVSATAYFYLDRPSSNLPLLNDKQLRIKDMKEKVWDKIKTN